MCVCLWRRSLRVLRPLVNSLTPLPPPSSLLLPPSCAVPSIIGSPEAQHVARYEIEMVLQGQAHTLGPSGQYGGSSQYGGWNPASIYGSYAPAAFGAQGGGYATAGYDYYGAAAQYGAGAYAGQQAQPTAGGGETNPNFVFFPGRYISCVCSASFFLSFFRSMSAVVSCG